MVGGFIVTGDSDKRVILRAIGPSLTGVGLTGVLVNPTLALYGPTGRLMEANDDRLSLPGNANPLLPLNPFESFLIAILPPGNYTAVLEGANGTSGVALVELYDMEPGSSGVANISSRGHIAAAADVMIGGFIIGPHRSDAVDRARTWSVAGGIRSVGSIAQPGFGNYTTPMARSLTSTTTGVRPRKRRSWPRSRRLTISNRPLWPRFRPAITLPLVHDATHSVGVGLV